MGKAAKARQTPEWKEPLGNAAENNLSPQELVPNYLDDLKKCGLNVHLKRIPWNKGLRTTGKITILQGFKAGSEELKQHSAEKSREYYAKLKELQSFIKNMDARSEVPEKVSKKNKANWDALSERGVNYGG